MSGDKGLPAKSVKGRPVDAGAKLALKIEPGLLKKIDSFIANQPLPKPTRFEAIRRMIAIGFEADREQRRAQRDEAAMARAADAELARSAHAAAKLHEDEKTERLRILRIAKEEHDKRVAANGPESAKTKKAAVAQGRRERATARKAIEMPEPAASKREIGAGRAKELAVGAVKKALADVDAPDDVKLERKRKLVAPPATEKIRKPR